MQAPKQKQRGYTGIIVIAVMVALIAIAAAVLVYHELYTKPLFEENQDLKELAELEKQEMENQYKEFDLQYEQLQRTINTN